MKKKTGSKDVQDIRHVEATRPEPWPGIPGRSEERENDLPTGTRRADQADVTEAQRKLEHDVHDAEEPTRE